MPRPPLAELRLSPSHCEPTLIDGRPACAVCRLPLAQLRHYRTCTAKPAPPVARLPGTELTRLLDAIGLHDTIGCGCRNKAARMNRWGPDGCRARMATIVRWLREAAKEKGITISDQQGRDLVTAAIAASEREVLAVNDLPPLYLRFRHGLGDVVQLTVVLRHLRSKWPGRKLYVGTYEKWLGVLDGLADEQFDHKAPAPDGCEVVELDWHEPQRCYANHPGTKAERCLLEVFNIEPDLGLCGYQLTPGPDAHAAADEWLADRFGDLSSRPPFALVHYHGHSSRARKDLTEKIAAETCEALVAAGVTPLVFDERGESPLNPEWLVRTLPPPIVTAALATRSRINIGIDSGPGHIFGAVANAAVIAWYEHHPYHFYEPNEHVLHLVPEDHHRLLKPRQAKEACEFFQQHYRHRAVGRERLPDVVAALLSPQPLTATAYEKQYYEEHRAAGLDYLGHGQWQESYGAWLVDCLDLRGRRVLDAGCACGSIALGFQKAGAITSGIDISQHMIFLGRDAFPGLDLHVRDLADLAGVRDESFHAVHSAQSAEHWDPEQVPTILGELRRVLKPGGLFFCSLDTVELFARQNRVGEALQLAGDPTHICVRPLAWWDEQRAATGFEDVTVDYRERLTNHPSSFLRRYDWDWWVWRRPAA